MQPDHAKAATDAFCLNLSLVGWWTVVAAGAVHAATRCICAPCQRSGVPVVTRPAPPRPAPPC